jgi:DNA-directed RNA polymerase II subunit RPB1
MHDIKNVSFTVLSASAIRKQSVCEVSSFKRTIEDGKFILQGVRDPRMGPLDNSICVTCKERKCSGHFGHIELSVMAYHVSWIRQVIQWLKCICFECGELLIRSMEYPSRVRMLSYYSQHVYTKCPTCYSKQSSYTWSKGKQAILKNHQIYPIDEVHEHLSKLSDYHVEDMGLSHPKDMILQCLPVPPPSVRPPIMMGNQVRGEDDLTYRLLQILRHSHNMKTLMDQNRPRHVLEEARMALQLAITGYIDHTKLPNQKRQGNKREYSSLSGQLKGKEGRIRGNLMGKRCDFTARSVITGDDFLSVGEVGVPESVAETLTIPVKVTAWNKKTLQEMLHADETSIRFVIRPTGSRVDLSFVSRYTITLDVGWTVERKLLDGDIVLFNRQPTLHKMGIMAHIVRVMKGSTFRMNLSCTTPYNADFDGDEMNLHALQTVQAQAEARHIMSVKYQIVSPQSNRPVMGIIQDALLGAYLLTGDVKISRVNFFRCVYNMPGWMGTVEQKELYTGHELISMTLPVVNWEGHGVKIVAGKLLYGQMTKKVLGTSHGSLIHVIYNDCGPDETVLFINRLQLVVHMYLSIRGFSVSISDMICSKEHNAYIHDECQRAYKDVENLSNESAINGRLNACRDSVGVKVQEPLDQSNQLYCMVSSGAKGSATNISQILAVVGQQNLEGGRIPNTWTDRTLPHFKRGVYGPREKGFIDHSYVEGLKPWEVFFHAISGREGVIDTAIKTATSGYIQRKFVKALENAVARSDGSIRHADGSVIQFLYGDDGFDAMCIEKQCIEPVDFDTDKIPYEEYLELTENQEYLGALNKWKDPVHRDTNHYMLPIPVDRIISTVQTIYKIGGIRLEQVDIFWRVDAFIKEVDNKMLKILFRYKMNSYRMYERKITDDQLTKIFFDIRRKLETIRISAGEAVGAVAAQSIGEPCTQMTLNTFHHAGNSAKNVTLGIPRLMELINCIQHIQTPVTTFTTEDTNQVVNKLKHVRLEDIVRSYCVKKTPAMEYFMLFPDEDYVAPTGETLVLNIENWYDVKALKRLFTEHRLFCAYTEGPHPIFHVHGIDDIGILYEQTLRKLTVSGIPGAEDVTVVRGTGIVTSLTSLSTLWDLGVHLNKITTNDVTAVVKYLGIEAGRLTLLSEIRNILGFYGLYVNVRHILLLVDWMTHAGIMTPLTRHGIKVVDESPLKRATFEEVVDIFNQAACLNETDELQGISERILIGATPNIGTNRDIDLIDDEVMIQDALPMPQETSNGWDPFDTWENPWATVQDSSVTEGEWWNEAPKPMFYQPLRPASPQYDPQAPPSPQYDPQAPPSPQYDPQAPPSPCSPMYSPASPMYSPTGAYSPASPMYSPASPMYSPTSPMYSPTKRQRV